MIEKHLKAIKNSLTDPGLRMESFAIIKLHGVNYKLYK
jgi:hypothetical protein